MLLSLTQTHICKSMTLVRTAAILFYTNLVYKSKENAQEMAFIYLACKMWLKS